MKRRRGILAALLFAAACLAAVPAGRVRAADQKVVTQTISRTRFEKVKNSSQNGLHVGNAGSSFHTVTFGSYTAVCTGINTQVNDTHFYDDPTLQITKDGTSTCLIRFPKGAKFQTKTSGYWYRSDVQSRKGSYFWLAHLIWGDDWKMKCNKDFVIYVPYEITLVKG